MLRDRLTDVLASRYRVGEELPGGGMARVFAGHDPNLDRQVVIKVLPPERATAVAIERFRREARLLARLSHPHVVPVLESGDGQGLLWFVMPRVTGQPLDDRLRSGALDEAEVRRIGGELLDALAHAHALGVVHRDIKPANVLLHAGHAVLADFGVALLSDGTDDSLTDTGQAVGTLAYMAPEQRAGRVDPRSDCWSLAATLYEASTGHRWDPATGERRWQHLPSSLTPALRRALAESPDERWPDAHAFRDALLQPKRPGRVTMAAAGIVIVGLALATAPWRGERGVPPGQSGDSLDLTISVAPGSGPATEQVARQAGLVLQWLPMIRIAPGDEGARPARIRIVLEERSRGGDTVLAIVAHGADGTLLDDRVLPADSTDHTTRGRLVARRIMLAHFPRRLVEFDQLLRSQNDVQAWSAVFDGLAAFQEGRFRAADTLLGRALRRDSTLMVAAWGRMLTHMWERDEIGPDLDLLARNVGELPPPIDLLVIAQREPDLRRRIAIFESVVRAHPDYAPARMLHANELFHRGALVGRPLADGVLAFSDARRATPDLDHVNTAEQVLWGATRVGDRTMARSAIDRLRDHPDRMRREFLLLAYDARFAPAAATIRRSVLLLVARGALLTELGRYLRFGLQFDLPSEQRRFAEVVLLRSDNDEVRADASAAMATALLMAGRPAAGLSSLAAAATLASRPRDFQLQVAEWQLLLPRFGLSAAAGAPMTATVERFVHDPTHAPRAIWVLALAALGRGDGAVAQQWRDSLRAVSGRDPVALELLSLLEAQLAADRGDFGAALALSDAIERDPGDAHVLARGPFARAVTKFSRGEWRLETGDTAGALAEWLWAENNDLQGWPSGPPQEGELDAALSTVVRLQRAVLLCRTGSRAAGAALRDRVEDLWAHAEPGLRRLPVRLAAGQACR